MKMKSIFAVNSRQGFAINISNGMDFLYPFGSVVDASILPSVSLYGLSLCYAKISCTLAGLRKQAVSFVFNSSFIHTMPRCNEICERVKYSISSTRRGRAKSTSIATIKLQCSNPHSIPCFSDVLNECKRRFDEEIALKDKAYSFIVSKGLFKEFISTTTR